MLENTAKSCHEFNRTFTPNMMALLISFSIIVSEIFKAFKEIFLWPLCLKTIKVSLTRAALPAHLCAVLNYLTT